MQPACCRSERTATRIEARSAHASGRFLSSWETAEHERRQAVSVVADVVQFLDTPGGGAADRDGDDLSGEDESRELVGVGADELDITF
jgi:hypothetical protein